MGIGHQRRKPGDTSVCKPGGAEQPGGFSLTEIEDPGQLAVDPEASKQITDEAKAYHIGDMVDKKNFLSLLNEAVFVVPELVGSDALFIDKKVRLLDMCDLGQPFRPQSLHKTDAIFDHLPGIHAGGWITDNTESQIRRRKGIEVAGIRKEGPDLLQTGADSLFAVKMMSHIVLRIYSAMLPE